MSSRACRYVYFQYNNHNFSTCNIEADVFEYPSNIQIPLLKYKCKRWVNIMKDDPESNKQTNKFPPKLGKTESKESRI